MRHNLKRALRILLGVAFIVAGINHFRDAPFYLRMMPDYLPAHAALVQLSGVTEMAAGVMVLVPRVAHWGARFVIAHLVIFLLVHVWMVQHADRFMEIPVAALWVRIALQFVFIAWAAWFARTPPTHDVTAPSAR